MINVANLVSQTSCQLAPQTVRIPLPLLSAFTLFHRVHVVWRSYRRAKVYTNPENFISLAAGHIVNYTVGDKLFVRISALCVLISKRILDVVRQIEKFQTSYEKVVSAVKGEFPAHIKYDASKRPSAAKELIHQTERVFARIKRIAIALFHLLKEAFKLSMKMMDAIEAFYLSPSTRNEGVQEIFVNSTKILDKLEKNQTTLHEGLAKNKKIIKTILTGINASFPVEKFIETAERSIKKTVPERRIAKRNQSTISKILLDIPKMFLDEIVSGTIFESVIPRSWKPMPFIEWELLRVSLKSTRSPDKRLITMQITPKNLIAKTK